MVSTVQAANLIASPHAQLSLTIIPMTFKRACEFITRNHRHHKKPTGMKFAVGVQDQFQVLHGVATAGRPVARAFDDGFCLEVNRACVDGFPNANSCLYGACVRVAKAMGYRRVITYTQEGESGASLKAVGWKMIQEIPARGSWAESSVKLRSKRDPIGAGGVIRHLWEKVL